MTIPNKAQSEFGTLGVGGFGGSTFQAFSSLAKFNMELADMLWKNQANAAKVAAEITTTRMDTEIHAAHENMEAAIQNSYEQYAGAAASFAGGALGVGFSFKDFTSDSLKANISDTEAFQKALKPNATGVSPSTDVLQTRLNEINQTRTDLKAKFDSDTKDVDAQLQKDKASAEADKQSKLDDIARKRAALPTKKAAEQQQIEDKYNSELDQIDREKQLANDQDREFLKKNPGSKDRFPNYNARANIWENRQKQLDADKDTAEKALYESIKKEEIKLTQQENQANAYYNKELNGLEQNAARNKMDLQSEFNSKDAALAQERSQVEGQMQAQANAGTLDPVLGGSSAPAPEERVIARWVGNEMRPSNVGNFKGLDQEETDLNQKAAEQLKSHPENLRTVRNAVNERLERQISEKDSINAQQANKWAQIFEQFGGATGKGVGAHYGVNAASDTNDASRASASSSTMKIAEDAYSSYVREYDQEAAQLASNARQIMEGFAQMARG